MLLVQLEVNSRGGKFSMSDLGVLHLEVDGGVNGLNVGLARETASDLRARLDSREYACDGVASKRTSLNSFDKIRP